MAARKKAKASKKAVKRGRGKTKAKKSPAKKKTKSRKAQARKPAKEASRKTTAKAAPRKTAAKKKVSAQGASARAGATTKGAAAKAGATKSNRKQIVGEGDYEASRAFLKDQADFVKENKARIPDMGKEARAALDGSEGPALMAAEAEAKGHSKNQPSENP